MIPILTLCLFLFTIVGYLTASVCWFILGRSLLGYQCYFLAFLSLELINLIGYQSGLSFHQAFLNDNTNILTQALGVIVAISGIVFWHEQRKLNLQQTKLDTLKSGGCLAG